VTFTHRRHTPPLFCFCHYHTRQLSLLTGDTALCGQPSTAEMQLFSQLVQLLGLQSHLQ
jgi:hypothetical protein